MSETSLWPARCELLATTAAAGAVSALPGMRRAAAESDSIRPFDADIPEEEIIELRWRVAATHWPDRETVSDRPQEARNRRSRIQP